MHRFLPFALAVLPACGPGSAQVGDPSVLPDIRAWNTGLSASDREAKYCKMARSPFAFFRGTNHLFWQDLGTDPRLEDYGDEQTRIWLQGDSHVLNFGAFDDDKERVVYDLNDFDEAVVADYQLDVWRLGISVVLAATDADFGADAIDGAVRELGDEYLDALREATPDDREDDIVFNESEVEGPLRDFLDEVKKNNSRPEMLAEWTALADGVPRLKHHDLAAATPAEEAAIRDNWDSYQSTLTGGLDPDPDYFEILDIQRRIHMGLGSLGTPRFYVLVTGDHHGARILDLKGQGIPAASTALPDLADPAPHPDHATRVAIAQKALALHVDDHLGTLTMLGQSFTVRDRSPYKEALAVDDIEGVANLEEVVEQWGLILAMAHARGDEDFDAEALPYSFEAAVTEIADGEHEEFSELTLEISREYAHHMEQGHLAFVAWLEEEFDYTCLDDEDDG